MVAMDDGNGWWQRMMATDDGNGLEIENASSKFDSDFLWGQN